MTVNNLAMVVGPNRFPAFKRMIEHAYNNKVVSIYATGDIQTVALFFWSLPPTPLLPTPARPETLCGYAYCIQIFVDTVVFGVTIAESSRRSGGGIPAPLKVSVEFLNAQGKNAET